MTQQLRESRSECYYFLDSYLQQSNIALEKQMTSSVSLYRAYSSFDTYYTRTILLWQNHLAVCYKIQHSKSQVKWVAN